MSTSAPQHAAAAPPKPLKQDPNFRWLMTGAVISMLGDQFSLIALPWLVLKMTGDPLAVGTVLAVTALPRAVFILLGGALVDRYSPKRVMMLTKHANTVMLALLAALVLTGNASLPAVYLLAFGIGLATAFSIPSGTAMLPSVVAPQQLEAANGLMMGLRQVTMFVGPLLAGVLISVFGDGGSGAARIAGSTGIGVAFALDALSFALSAWTLSKVAMRPAPSRAAGAAHEPVLRAVLAGLRGFWADTDMRRCFIYWGAIALLITGPIQIALPLLASTRLGGDAAAFGVLIGAHGFGTLIGMAVSGAQPKLRARSFGLTILIVDAAVGLLFLPMGQVTATWQAAGLLLAIGVLGGFIQVAVFSWIQRRVPRAMLGRAMSLFMFIFMGLTPVSAAVTGWLLRSVSLNTVFVGCGAMLLAIVAVALFATRLASVGYVSSNPEA